MSSDQVRDGHATVHSGAIGAALGHEHTGCKTLLDFSEIGRLQAAPVLGTRHPDNLHTPGSRVCNHRGVGGILVAANDTHGGESLLGAHRRQRMQVVRPGTTEGHQAIDTFALRRGEIACKFEVFIAGGETAPAIESQQRDIAHGNRRDRAAA